MLLYSDMIYDQLLDDEKIVPKDVYEKTQPVNQLRLELGLHLVVLANESTFKNEISLIKKRIKKKTGVYIPEITVVDNPSLGKSNYRILLNDTVVIGKGYLNLERQLALKTPQTLRDIDGEPAQDPIFGEDGYWIEEKKLQEAREAKYQITKPRDVLTIHLQHALEENLSDIINRKYLVDVLGELSFEHGHLISELDYKEVYPTVIQTILKSLVKEKISIRNLPLIVESILDAVVNKKDEIRDIYNEVRTSLVREIVADYVEKDEVLKVLLLEDGAESSLEYAEINGKLQFTIPVEELEEFFKKIIFYQSGFKGKEVLVVSNEAIREAFVNLFNTFKVNLPVLSSKEVSLSGVKFEVAAKVPLEIKKTTKLKTR